MRKSLLSLVLLLPAPLSLRAQAPATGFPPYGSFEDGNFDAINRQNLDVNLTTPIVVSPARGIDLTFSIVYDSLIWQKYGNSWIPVFDSNGLPTWGWKLDSVTGQVAFTSQTLECEDPAGGPSQYTISYSDYSFTDRVGTKHVFNVSFALKATNCNYSTGPRTGYATDGSGYYLDATSLNNPLVYDTNGMAYTKTGTLTDTNGNFVSKSVSGNVTTWGDTVGRSALKIITNSTSIQYQFLDPTGAYQTATLNFGTFDVKTNFSCAGVVEYNATAVSLPTSLVLPNGKSYSFTYEDTPDFTGYTTARLKRVTLPAGGHYEYQYPSTFPATYHNGIVCADATVNRLTRVINDGTTSVTWQFARTNINGPAGTTTITAPQLSYNTALNQTVITFDASGHDTSRKTYL